MRVALGIDTGGTYTDAVLVNQADGGVLVSSKALTTRHDLSIGIERAIGAVLDRVETEQAAVSTDEIELVGLSTTLATNSIVEGQGSSVCLLLIGYDPTLIQQYGFEGELVTQDVVYLNGGHDAEGNEVVPLDEGAAREAILTRKGQVSAFAVSGYFGVRNPDHELRVRALVEELATGKDELPFPVTCGHELTTRLNAVRRATTAALNARLIPLLRDLIATVRGTLDRMGIAAPLMIVKGDGSLVRSVWAMRRPIETILSGPAASVVGAWHLAGRRDVWVVDVGGTTTDIASLSEGRPRLNPEGATVGGWRTMIEAADVHTVGLGGDSHVRRDGNHLLGAGGLTIGPRRVVPLSLLASEYPQVVGELRLQLSTQERKGLAGQFVLSRGRLDDTLSARDRDLYSHLEKGPRSLAWLIENAGHGLLVLRYVEELVSRQVLMLSCFTPTDALHVLGQFERWDADAAQLGAELIASQFDLSARALCERVVSGVSNRVTTELVSKVLNDEVALPNWQQETSAAALLARAMGCVAQSDLGCRLTLGRPLVAVGAPVEAYLPLTADQLGTELVIPPHADVANAVGAVVGSVVQRLRALVRPVDSGERFRLHLPAGFRDYEQLEDAVAYAADTLPGKAATLAREAGADHVEVQVLRDDRIVPLKEGQGQEIYVETELVFTAVGRPSLVWGE